MTPPVRPERINPFDIKKRVNPFDTVTSTVEEPKSVEIEPSTYTQISNSMKYIWNAFGMDGQKNLKDQYTSQAELNANTINVMKQMGTDVSTMGKNVYDYLSHPIDSFENTASQISNQGPTNLLKGVALSFASIPVTFTEAITSSKKGPNGEVLPASVEDQAKAMWGSVAVAMSAGVGSKVSALMAPSDAMLAGLNKVGFMGTLAKATLPSIATGAAVGGTFSAVSDVGGDDQLAQTISGLLAGGATGGLLEVMRPFNAVAKLQAKGAEFRGTQSANTLASLRALEITPNSTVEEIGAKIKAYATSADALDGAVQSNIGTGRQFVIDKSVPEDVVNRVVDRYIPAERESPGIVDLGGKVKSSIYKTKLLLPKLKGVPGQVEAKILDPFDKASFMALKDESILKELVAKTDLTEAEIQSHGNFVKQAAIAAREKGVQTTDPAILQERTRILKDTKAAELEALKEGESKDGWIKMKGVDKNGKAISQFTNGSQIVDATTAASTLVKPQTSTPFITLPKQNFSPEFGREAMRGTTLYKANNGTHLASSYVLAPDVEAFFKRTGFMPNELVSFLGDPHTIVDGELLGERVKLKSVATGGVKKVNSSSIVRLPSGLSSEFYPQENGPSITKMGIYNVDSYFDEMYKRFKDAHLKLEETPDAPYSTTIMKFAGEMGMKNIDDIQAMGKAFYSRMVDEVRADWSSSEKEIYENSLKRQEKFQNEVEDQRIGRIHNKLLTNNQALFHRGGNVYDIKDLSTGNILTDGGVKSLEEAENFIGVSRQASGFDLDGGWSQGMPTYGTNLQSPYDYKAGQWLPKIAASFDAKINVGHAKLLATSKAAISAFDTHSGTNFLPHYQALQVAGNFLRNLRANPVFSHIMTGADELINESKDISKERRIVINEHQTSIPSSELKSKFKLRLDDENLAQGISEVGYGRVVDFLSEVRKQSNGAVVGSPGFKRGFNKAIEGMSPDEELKGVIGQIYGKVDGSPKLVGTLALARNLSSGEPVSYNLSASERLAVGKLDKFARSVGATDPIFVNPAYSNLAELIGHNPFPGYSQGTLRQINKLVVTPENQTEIDPFVAAHNFRLATMRSAKVIPEELAYFMDGKKGNLISIQDVFDRAKEEISSYRPRSGDDPGMLDRKEKQAQAVTYFQQHLDNARGIPDVEKQFSKAANNMLEEIYGKPVGIHDYTRLANAVTYSALLSGRPAFAARDIVNAWTNVAVYDSFEAANGVFKKTFTVKDVQGLVDKGVVRMQGPMDLLNPNDDFLNVGDKLAKSIGGLSDLATKWNGQQWAHMHSIAGTYFYYHDLVGELSGKLVKNDITKAKAYETLKIGKLPPAEAKMFDDLISAGRTDQAADMLGRSMADRVNHTFGGNNSPQAWQSKFGRLAGGFGQWAVQQINTTADQFTRGSRKEILSAAARMTAVNGAIAYVGSKSGIDLHGWMVTPLTIPIGSPLVKGIIGGVQGINNTLSSNPSIRNPALVATATSIVPGLEHNKKEGYHMGLDNWDHLTIPMSYMMQGEINGIRELQGGFGPVAGVGQMLGFDVNKDYKSDLQSAMGLHPKWNGRSLGKPK